MEKNRCVGWAMKYFKDCLCNIRDEVSFFFGIASLVCWAMAEIPQIITNFKNKSADGVSLAFIFTWIAGDAFNLIGCILEPATLPTQYYTALLYTATTMVLALQCLYYDHFLRRWRHRQSQQEERDTDERRALTRRINDGIRRNDPVEVPRQKDFHFISARSLAGSDASPALHRHSESSSSDDEATTIIPEAAYEEYPKPLSSQPRPIPRPMAYGTFIAAAAAYLPRAAQGYQLGLMGRRFLQEQEVPGSSKYGQWFGWLMAAIYMGGRLPQIWLNIKRGSVEGLNPLMFIFALIANATYVVSILVRSTEWEKIKANMPWLLDALVCVALDSFIIIQYIFYRFVKRNQRRRTLGKYYDGSLEPECYKPRSSY